MDTSRTAYQENKLKKFNTLDFVEEKKRHHEIGFSKSYRSLVMNRASYEHCISSGYV